MKTSRPRENDSGEVDIDWGGGGGCGGGGGVGEPGRTSGPNHDDDPHLAEGGFSADTFEKQLLESSQN